MVTYKVIDGKEFIVKSKLPASDYVVNPYVGCSHKCIYCYARFMKRFTNHIEPWGDFVDIKEFKNYKLPKDIKGKYIFISSVTDPYNHFESKYLKTRTALEILKDIDCNIGILTKSKLVTRDIDLFKQMNNIEIGISINTLDDSFRKLIEPCASNVEDRINALKILKGNGIKTYLFMSPIFPKITDFKVIIEKTKDFVDYYCFENLNLRADYKYEVLNMIKDKYKDLYPLYKDIFIDNNVCYWDIYKKDIIDYCEKNNISYKIYFHHSEIKKR
ncbi:MAG: radical SAM protein [Bacilli bacterium]